MRCNISKVFGVCVLTCLIGLAFGCKVDSDRIARRENETGKLNIIGSYHEDMVKGLAEMYSSKYGVEVSYVRMPTGDAEAKLISEKDSPTCDVWIGGTVDAHEILKQMGILEAYKSKEEEYIEKQYLDPEGVWKAQYIEVLSIGINNDRWEEEFSKSGIEMPSTLEDLLDPRYKGEIVMPNPVTSGTGYTFIASVISAMGETKGWEYLKLLNNQIGQYTYSGYTAAEKVGLGQYLICINFMSDQLLVKSFGYNTESFVYEGAGWTAVPVSLVGEGRNSVEAKRFIDFCLTKEACDTLVGLGNVISVRGDSILAEGGYALSDLNFNKNYDPISGIEDKEERIKRFSSMMP